jgi:guanine deaminase
MKLHGLKEQSYSPIYQKCNMDRKIENPDYYIDHDYKTSLHDTSALISHIRALSPISSHASIGTAPEPLLQPILTPRFAIACTEKMLDGISALADEYDSRGRHSSEPRMRIQTHISENRGEVERVRELYPKAKSYADVYDSHGILRDTTILAHAVHLTDDEVRLVKERNAGISHCPTSNFYLSSGVAPIGKYLDQGVKVRFAHRMPATLYNFVDSRLALVQTYPVAFQYPC